MFLHLSVWVYSRNICLQLFRERPKSFLCTFFLFVSQQLELKDCLFVCPNIYPWHWIPQFCFFLNCFDKFGKTYESSWWGSKCLSESQTFGFRLERLKGLLFYCKLSTSLKTDLVLWWMWWMCSGPWAVLAASAEFTSAALVFLCRLL